jgi:2-oxoglutarate ferredoxin oxidoreductase subunit delta
MSNQPMASVVTVRTRGTVTIDVEHCKGCELCIPACPPRVLTMSEAVNHMGYRYPQLHPGCTGCGACLYVCPDFVFEVFRFHQPVEHDVTVPAVTAGTPEVTP